MLACHTEAVLVCDTSGPRASSPRVTTDAVVMRLSAAGGRRFCVQHGCVLAAVEHALLAACKTLESGKLQKRVYRSMMARNA